jgi:hypothetical protein
MIATCKVCGCTADESEFWRGRDPEFDDPACPACDFNDYEVSSESYPRAVLESEVRSKVVKT